MRTFDPVECLSRWILGGWPTTDYPPSLPDGWEAVATGRSSAATSHLVGGLRAIRAIGAPDDARAPGYHRDREDWAAARFPEHAPAVRVAIQDWARRQRRDHQIWAVDRIVTANGFDEAEYARYTAAALAGCDSPELRDAERA